MPPKREPVVAGWFTGDAAEPGVFRLLGTACAGCGAVFFPREDARCRDPRCGGTRLEEVPLSPRGRIWSYTDARYRPPAPYASDPSAPWEPYALVAVELAAEGLVVLGQAVPGVRVDDLAVGMEAEVVPGVLDPGGERERATWHWRPVRPGAADGGARDDR